MTNFGNRLREAGYDAGTDQFHQVVDQVFATQFPDFQTDEQLKRHPPEAQRLCDVVRGVLDLPGLPCDLILGVLENYRKKRKRVAENA